MQSKDAIEEVIKKAGKAIGVSIKIIAKGGESTQSQGSQVQGWWWC